MAKLTNVRERVHQPFWDTLIRTAGMGGSSPRISDRVKLFTNQSRTDDITAVTNLDNGSTLPSDQSHVTLALRVFVWFRNPQVRSAVGGAGIANANGDFDPTSALLFFGSSAASGNSIGNVEDVFRLYWQSMEQLHWSFGTGEKFSITNMQTKYFPDGGGLYGDLGDASDLINFVNGMPTHEAILRLARAVLLPPRQNVLCQATISQLPDGGNSAINLGPGLGGLGTTTSGGRNMLSLKDNLNAADGIDKVVQFTFDGLFARDVQ
jgi:hypothetical protein